MTLNLKKMWPAFATSLVAITSCLNAVDDMQMRNIENRVTALEQRRGSNGMINPPTRPVVKDGCDLWVQAEALYMNATEDGLGFVIKSDTTSFPDGHVKSVDYDWTWGFRLGAGYNLPHDGWDLFLNWTWFHSHESKDEDADVGGFPVTITPGSADGAAIAHDAEGHAHLRMNILDLELGREFFVSKWLMVRPHAGIRGAWIHRHYETEFSSFVSGASGVSKIEDEFHNRYRGVGLRSGFDTQWGLGSGWSIYGQMAFSLLYGRHLLHYEEDAKLTTGAHREQGDAINRWDTVRAITDLALGLRWDQLFYSDRYRIRLQLGWEQHMFFGFNKDMSFSDNISQGVFVANKGDLAVSGLAFQARFDF